MFPPIPRDACDQDGNGFPIHNVIVSMASEVRGASSAERKTSKAVLGNIPPVAL